MRRSRFAIPRHQSTGQGATVVSPVSSMDVQKLPEAGLRTKVPAVTGEAKSERAQDTRQRQSVTIVPEGIHPVESRHDQSH